jgi:hypothetical protein
MEMGSPVGLSLVIIAKSKMITKAVEGYPLQSFALFLTKLNLIGL